MLVTPAKVVAGIVPWLLLFATVLFAAGPLIARRAQAAAGHAQGLDRWREPGLLAVANAGGQTQRRHGGGAVLLDEPPRLEQITQAVRHAVPAAIPVTAKMRLGVRDTRLALACAVKAVELCKRHLDAKAGAVGQLQCKVGDGHGLLYDVVHQQLRAKELAAVVLCA